MVIRRCVEMEDGLVDCREVLGGLLWKRREKKGRSNHRVEGRRTGRDALV